jgi:hypothetical protein
MAAWPGFHCTGCDVADQLTGNALSDELVALAMLGKYIFDTARERNDV